MAWAEINGPSSPSPPHVGLIPQDSTTDDTRCSRTNCRFPHHIPSFTKAALCPHHRSCATSQYHLAPMARKIESQHSLVSQVPLVLLGTKAALPWPAPFWHQLNHLPLSIFRSSTLASAEKFTSQLVAAGTDVHCSLTEFLPSNVDPWGLGHVHRCQTRASPHSKIFFGYVYPGNTSRPLLPSCTNWRQISYCRELLPLNIMPSQATAARSSLLPLDQSLELLAWWCRQSTTSKWGKGGRVASGDRWNWKFLMAGMVAAEQQLGLRLRVGRESNWSSTEPFRAHWVICWTYGLVGGLGLLSLFSFPLFSFFSSLLFVLPLPAAVWLVNLIGTASPCPASPCKHLGIT